MEGLVVGYTIEFQNVSKIFKGIKEDKVALENISFLLEENKICGLIGSNGAGKTTLLKLLSNHIFPSQGQIIFNRDTFTQNSNLQQDICFMKDQELLYSSYKIKTILKIASSLYPKWDNNYAEKLMNILGLKEDKKYNRLSKGQKGKVNIIIALASRAKITIFDETYISLDAPSRKKFFDLLIEDYTEYPRTIILSTHYIDEVSRIFEDIILINNGQLLLHETQDQLQEKSLTLMGDKKLGQKLLKNINVIYTESFGSMCAFSIYDTISHSFKKELVKNNFEISITPVEKWFVHMISKGEN